MGRLFPLAHHLRVALLFLAAVCGPIPGAAALPATGFAQEQQPPPDACSLLTAKDLQTVVGQPYTAAAEPSPQPGGTLMSGCSFPNNPPGNPFPVVTVTLTAADGPDTFAAVQAASQANDPANTAPLDGIGDAAFASPGGQVYFLKDSVMVYVMIIAPANSRTDILTWATALATIAASRF